MSRGVLILGCGPTGLIAAEAADALGYHVTIMSKKVKSHMPGAQYLHEPVPDVTTAADARLITYQKIGTREGYAAKLYGSPDAPCSWDYFPEGECIAYPIGAIYDRLWERWEYNIEHVDLDAARLFFEIHEQERGDEWDLIVSSIPKPILCNGGHTFSSQEIFITDTAWSGVDEDTIVYNGDTADHWYRSSRLFGFEYTESTIATPTAEQGIKPLDNDCTCWQPSGVLCVGRFGAWKKGILVHHAYKEVTDALHALSR